MASTAGPDRNHVTRLLLTGVPDTPSEMALVGLVYDELRRMAQGLLRKEVTVLDPTVLVHEAWMRMVDPAEIAAGDADELRRRFLMFAARAMRRVLIDRARRRQAAKHGGGWCKITLSESAAETDAETTDLLDLEAALAHVEETNPRLARVAELRLLAGLNSAEVGEALGIGESTAAAEWALARVLLIKQLG